MTLTIDPKNNQGAVQVLIHHAIWLAAVRPDVTIQIKETAKKTPRGSKS